jgi:hypothetical protein
MALFDRTHDLGQVCTRQSLRRVNREKCGFQVIGRVVSVGTAMGIVRPRLVSEQDLLAAAKVVQLEG